MNHPAWIIKFVHKSKVNAVKIVTWEEHHEIATVTGVYTYNGDESEGAKAARLIASAPELLEALESLERVASYTFHNNPQLAEEIINARAAIAKAKGE